MLGIFQKSIAHPPQELNSPDSGGSSRRVLPKNPDEILKEFYSLHTGTSFSANLNAGAAVLASVGHYRDTTPLHRHQRLVCSFNEIYCMFVGTIGNLGSLIRRHSFWKSDNDALFLIQAYLAMCRDGPYRAYQFIKYLEGSFAFVLYDNRAGNIFAAQSSDGAIPLYWGIAGDGSLVISEEEEVVKGGCDKSSSPFPAGCMFHSEGGLRSFEHPMNKMKAMPRVDSEGVMCGVTFSVDKSARLGGFRDWIGRKESSP